MEKIKKGFNIQIALLVTNIFLLSISYNSAYGAEIAYKTNLRAPLKISTKEGIDNFLQAGIRAIIKDFNDTRNILSARKAGILLDAYGAGYPLSDSIRPVLLSNRSMPALINLAIRLKHNYSASIELLVAKLGEKAIPILITMLRNANVSQGDWIDPDDFIKIWPKSETNSKFYLSLLLNMTRYPKTSVRINCSKVLSKLAEDESIYKMIYDYYAERINQEAAREIDNLRKSDSMVMRPFSSIAQVKEFFDKRYEIGFFYWPLPESEGRIKKINIVICVVKGELEMTYYSGRIGGEIGKTLRGDRKVFNALKKLGIAKAQGIITIVKGDNNSVLLDVLPSSGIDGHSHPRESWSIPSQGMGAGDINLPKSLLDRIHRRISASI